MKTSTLVFLFASFLLLPSLKAQQTGDQTSPMIRGTIVEGLTKEPLIGANVLIKTLGDTLVSNTVTGIDGTFELAYPRLPSFLLEISYVGYEKISRTLSRGVALDLGVIFLNEVSKLLGEVVI